MITTQTTFMMIIILWEGIIGGTVQYMMVMAELNVFKKSVGNVGTYFFGTSFQSHIKAFNHNHILF